MNRTCQGSSVAKISDIKNIGKILEDPTDMVIVMSRLIW